MPEHANRAGIRAGLAQRLLPYQPVKQPEQSVADSTNGHKFSWYRGMTFCKNCMKPLGQGTEKPCPSQEGH